MVTSGHLVIQLRDRGVVLNPNDVFVVPRCVEHCPKAGEVVHAILFEPKGTVDTGDAFGELKTSSEAASWRSWTTPAQAGRHLRCAVTGWIA